MGKKRAIVTFLLSLLLLTLLASFVFAKPKIEKQTFTSNNKKRTFYLIVPDAVKSDAKLPLLLVFHGSGRNGLSIVETWQEVAAKANLIVAGLDSFESSNWSTTRDGPSVLRDLVQTLESKYPIDPRRIYLFGHSGGAVFAIDIAMIESEYFAAVAVHAGSWRQKQEFDVMRSAQRKIPLAIWVGTKDPFFSLESVHSTRDALAAAGFHVEVVEMPGHDHWYYDLAPKINEAAWKFLEQYELTTEPRYAESVDEADASSANKLIAEVNALQSRVMEFVKQTNLLESQIGGKDLTRDRIELQKLATQEIDLLTQAAAAAQSAADKSKRIASMKIGDNNRAYFQVTVKYYLKFAELLSAKRAEAEVLLTSDSAEAVSAKRDDARKKTESLEQELNALHAEAEKARP
jgi:poly(3-hydroxybutyrate) depolymerase